MTLITGEDRGRDARGTKYQAPLKSMSGPSIIPDIVVPSVVTNASGMPVAQGTGSNSSRARCSQVESWYM